MVARQSCERNGNASVRFTEALACVEPRLHREYVYSVRKISTSNLDVSPTNKSGTNEQRGKARRGEATKLSGKSDSHSQVGVYIY